jgi:hypothetical protein
MMWSGTWWAMVGIVLAKVTFGVCPASDIT